MTKIQALVCSTVGYLWNLIQTGIDRETKALKASK